MGRRGPSRVAVLIAAVLAAGWLAVSAGLHVLAVRRSDGPDAIDGVVGAAFLWAIALLFVGVPAVVAGVAAVSTTRHPGTGPGLWWAARLAFWAALTGPAEVLALGLVWLALFTFRSVAGMLI